MTTFTTVSVSPGAARIAGIDVAQLLHDIGETSAKDNGTALFGLLLRAQRVLAQVQAENAAMRAPRKSVLLATYHAMNDDGRDRLISYAGQLQKRFPRQRAALMLVQLGDDGGSR